MSYWLRCLSLVVFLLLVGPPDSPCGETATTASWEQIRGEVNLLRETLNEYQARLDKLQRLCEIARYRVPRETQLFGQPVPMQRRDVWERMDREFLLAVDDAPQALLWLKRANRFFPMIQKQLERRGLPDDLKYVAIVESALQPRVRSWAGAVGLWQFIPATGSRYSLLKTDWVDERRDPLKATEAALSYLEDLHGMLGDWFLAVAAYNCGEERVERELKRQHVTSYFDLLLPIETERYVFKIAAAKVILSNPKAYGFDLGPDELYDPLEAEPIQLHVKRRNLDLISLANACDMTYRSMLELNPQFRGSVVPRGSYTFYLPPEKEKRALAFLETWNDDKEKGTALASTQVEDKIIHRVKAGETLGQIAEKYRVYVNSIKRWNNLKDVNHIRTGQRLVIYK